MINTTDTRQHTQSPTTTGATVIAIKYKDGVLMATDLIASYGSYKRFYGVRRITSIGSTLIGADGDISDFQQLEKFIDDMKTEQERINDGISYAPDEVLHRLTALLYKKRSDMDPYWNDIVVAGVDQVTGKPFIGTSDKIGTSFTSDWIATGYAFHACKQLLEKTYRDDLTFEEAKALIADCLRICFYRYKQADKEILFAKVEKGKEAEISTDSELLETKWNYSGFVNTVSKTGY